MLEQVPIQVIEKIPFWAYLLAGGTGLAAIVVVVDKVLKFLATRKDAPDRTPCVECPPMVTHFGTTVETLGAVRTNAETLRSIAEAQQDIAKALVAISTILKVFTRKQEADS